MRKYLSESHKAYSEACQKEVEEMLQHPLSHEQFLEQIERQRKASNLQGAREEVLTATQIRYAEECLEADKTLPKLHLTTEQMRAQVQRIHAEAIKEKEKIDGSSDLY